MVQTRRTPRQCIKLFINTGILATKCKWCSLDFWTINCMSWGCHLSLSDHGHPFFLKFMGNLCGTEFFSFQPKTKQTLSIPGSDMKKENHDSKTSHVVSWFARSKSVGMKSAWKSIDNWFCRVALGWVFFQGTGPWWLRHTNKNPIVWIVEWDYLAKGTKKQSSYVFMYVCMYLYIRALSNLSTFFFCGDRAIPHLKDQLNFCGSYPRCRHCWWFRNPATQVVVSTSFRWFLGISEPWTVIASTILTHPDCRGANWIAMLRLEGEETAASEVESVLFFEILSKSCILK